MIGGYLSLTNFMGQPPASVLHAPSWIRQRRAGKFLVNTDAPSILVQPAAQRGLSRYIIASDSDPISDIVTPSRQTPDLGKLEVINLKAMASGKDQAYEKYMFGKGWDSEKMLQLYIYDRMKKRGLHNTAEIFSKEVNLKMVELVNSKEGILQEWWEVFWAQFSSRMTNYGEEASRSEQPPTGFEKGPLGFSPAQLLSTEITPMPPSGNASHQQMPVTLLAPPQVVKVPGNDVSGERSVQVGSTCPAGQGSAYPSAASNAGSAFSDLGKLKVLLYQMVFGRECDNRRKLAFKNKGDA